MPDTWVYSSEDRSEAVESIHGPLPSHDWGLVGGPLARGMCVVWEWIVSNSFLISFWERLLVL